MLKTTNDEVRFPGEIVVGNYRNQLGHFVENLVKRRLGRRRRRRFQTQITLTTYAPSRDVRGVEYARGATRRRRPAALPQRFRCRDNKT